jgi:hypothetical protein
MEKMLFTTNGIGRLKRTAVEIFKTGDNFLGSSQITTPLARYRLVFEETVDETIEMIIRGAVSNTAITRMIPDKIVDQGFRDRMSHPRTS